MGSYKIPPRTSIGIELPDDFQRLFKLKDLKGTTALTQDGLPIAISSKLIKEAITDHHRFDDR